MTAEQAQSYMTALSLQAAAKQKQRQTQTPTQNPGSDQDSDVFIPNGDPGSPDGSSPSNAALTGNMAGAVSGAATGGAQFLTRSLTWDPDEGTFTWGGKTYSKVADLVKAWNNASLSDADEAVLRQKFKAQTGVDLSEYGY